MVSCQTYRLFLVSCIVLFTFSTFRNAEAQNQKIGYVDTDHILSQMSEYEGIQQQLETISKEWKAQLEEMEDEIEELKEDFEAKEVLYTDEQREQKQQEIRSKERQRQQFLEQKFGSEGEYFSRQQELLEPVQRKVFDAINVIAQQQNFDFVFDRAQDSNMLYGGEQWNLNDEVLQELGITLNESSN